MASVVHACIKWDFFKPAATFPSQHLVHVFTRALIVLVSRLIAD